MNTKLDITLVPRAGLCNRLNAITSGILYAQKNPNVKLKILWWKSHDCCCKWSDLFQQLPSPFEIKPMRSLVKNKPGSRKNLFIPDKLRNLFYDVADNYGSRHSDEFDAYLTRLCVDKKERATVYVSSDNRWNECELRSSLASLFIPIDELQEKIKKYTSQYGENTIGVHIRRTDHKASINNCPTELFIKAMEEEIERDNTVKFYVASDDYEVKKQMISKFGKERVLTQDLVLKRSSVDGMKDAVVDLWCLGSCCKLYGSISTYSYVASLLYNIERITLRK